MGFLENATVNTLYLVLLALGLIYALFLLFSGQLGGNGDVDIDAGGDIDLGMDADVDLSVDAGDIQHGISPISPLTIATFVTAFGATGLVSTSLFNVSEQISIVWASLGGILFSVLVYLGFTYLFIKPQGSSEVRIAELSGRLAEVITPIPDGGIGEIAFIAQGGRVTFSARDKGGGKINRGVTVRIVRIVGGLAYVEPQIEE